MGGLMSHAKKFITLQVLVLGRDIGQAKMGLNWEAPYLVSEVGNLGAYKLQTLDEKQFPKP